MRNLSFLTPSYRLKLESYHLLRHLTFRSPDPFFLKAHFQLLSSPENCFPKLRKKSMKWIIIRKLGDLKKITHWGAQEDTAWSSLAWQQNEVVRYFFSITRRNSLVWNNNKHGLDIWPIDFISTTTANFSFLNNSHSFRSNTEALEYFLQGVAEVSNWESSNWWYKGGIADDLLIAVAEGDWALAVCDYSVLRMAAWFLFRQNKIPWEFTIGRSRTIVLDKQH